MWTAKGQEWLLPSGPCVPHSLPLGFPGDYQPPSHCAPMSALAFLEGGLRGPQISLTCLEPQAPGLGQGKDQVSLCLTVLGDLTCVRGWALSPCTPTLFPPDREPRVHRRAAGEGLSQAGSLNLT